MVCNQVPKKYYYKSINVFIHFDTFIHAVINRHLNTITIHIIDAFLSDAIYHRLNTTTIFIIYTYLSDSMFLIHV